jgi:hypothetical protein
VPREKYSEDWTRTGHGTIACLLLRLSTITYLNDCLFHNNTHTQTDARNHPRRSNGAFGHPFPHFSYERHECVSMTGRSSGQSSGRGEVELVGPASVTALCGHIQA